MIKLRTARPAFATVAAASLLGIAGLAVANTSASAAPARHVVASAAAVAGGTTVYQVKQVNESIALGSQADPTTLAVKAVPAGKYLVTGEIGVNTQPGSFIVCAVSNTTAGNDGVFGVYTNQTSEGAQENVNETEVVTVSSGQSIHLTCDDNNGKPGDDVGSTVLEATPVNSLH